MKKTIKITFIIAAIMVSVAACTDALDDKSLIDDTPLQTGLTVEEAATVFQQKIIDYEILKEQVNVPVNPLLPADYTPQWHNAVSSESEKIWSIEAPIINRHRGLATSHMNESKPWEAAITQKVVVIKNKQTYETEMFVLSLIPDRKLFKKRRSHRGRTYTHVGDTREFSGMAIYTLWEGTNILIKEHDEKGIREPFRYDRKKTFDEQQNFSEYIIGGTGDLILMGSGFPGDDPCELEGCTVYPEYCVWCLKLKSKCTCNDPPTGPGGGGNNDPPPGDGGGPYIPPGNQDPDGGNNPPQTQKYTVTITVNGNGTVTGAGEYNAGANVTLMAIADSGYRFTIWQGITGAVNLSPVTITNIQKNYNIVANFVPNPIDPPKVYDDWDMDEKSKNELKAAFDSLYKDCVGQILLNAVPDGFKVVYDPNMNYLTSYSGSSNTFKWKMDTSEGVFMYAIFEEFFHVYQRQQGTFIYGPAVNGRIPILNLINLETEAKIAAYKYTLVNGLDEWNNWHSTGWDNKQKKIMDKYLKNSTISNYNAVLNNFVKKLDEYKDFYDRVMPESNNTNLMNELFNDCDKYKK